MRKGRQKKICGQAYSLSGDKFPRVVYGLEGIMQIFGVSKATASRYKNTIFKDAVSQMGRVIVVDTAECLKIFGQLHSENLVKSK